MSRGRFRQAQASILFGPCRALLGLCFDLLPRLALPRLPHEHLHILGQQQPVAAFKTSKMGPDLFSFAADERAKVRDFYFPNDTHLSMHGQLILGERMLQAIHQVLPPPAPRLP